MRLRKRRQASVAAIVITTCGRRLRGSLSPDSQPKPLEFMTAFQAKGEAELPQAVCRCGGRLMPATEDLWLRMYSADVVADVSQKCLLLLSCQMLRQMRHVLPGNRPKSLIRERSR